MNPRDPACSPKACAMAAMLCSRLLCRTTTPHGELVLPDVYWMTATSLPEAAHLLGSVDSASPASSPAWLVTTAAVSSSGAPARASAGASRSLVRTEAG